ncbi:MAG: hypothetical protein IIW54_09405 [Lachnospiraceae bacterium]|nr:hypothetical protein [Lachnospiraceae bacterium]
MNYEMKGYLFDKETGRPLPIVPGIIVSGYDEAFNIIKNVGYEYYILTLNKIREEE